MNDYAVAPNPTTVRLERLLPGPIERAWEYLTDSEKRGKWFASGNMELKKGGSVEFVFDHDQLSDEPYPEDYRKYKGSRLSGTVTRYEPPRVLAYTWNGPDGKHSEVTFELTPKGKDVLLVLTHSRIASRESMKLFAGGWHSHLGVLADILGGRRPRPFWSDHVKNVREYETRL
jgi:uncharacterized protein YndB with AHSA1/START domain